MQIVLSVKRPLTISFISQDFVLIFGRILMSLDLFSNLKISLSAMNDAKVAPQSRDMIHATFFMFYRNEGYSLAKDDSTN